MAFCLGLQQVAGLGQGFFGVDEDATARHARTVGLAHGGRVAAYQVQMRTGHQPGALHQWCGGWGGATDDVGRAHGGLQIGRHDGVHTIGAQLRDQPGRAVGVAVPDRHLGQARAHAAHRRRQQRSHPPCAHHQQTLRVRARQQASRQR